MAITVEFTRDIAAKDTDFVSFQHLRDFLRSICFASKYRVRSYENEFGRISRRDLFGVSKNEEEHYIGNIIMSGDRQ